MSNLRITLMVICIDENDITVCTQTKDLNRCSLKATLANMFTQASKSSPDYQNFKLEEFEDTDKDEHETFTVYYSTLIPKIARNEGVLWEGLGDIKNEIVKKALLNI